MKNSEVEKKCYDMQEGLNKTLGISEDFKFVAVGYLDITGEYEKGIVSQSFINKLKIIWNEGATLCSMGHHDCEFCIDEGNYENRATSSSEKVLVDRENNIKYIFPEMIFHYMEVHNFKPSDEFIKFVMGHHIEQEDLSELKELLEEQCKDHK